ncbi:gliding motility-associated C-terminal domain-containing protein [Hymenobacter sp. 15J16-1T3B]|uniref:DUF7948 domain-containing protein n=1 Tax=Hymenobacter sp. 15J16-1T3B TaxID=2886941 RepID=UPI001D11E704|nr:gliding motility-associated C-terminal domain-containing protein [Hymenobacter sp. 15J16-1T3B]MCC3159971.1 gliding motility-associated C-terminal domain-containing protein [Hymenobacter sp. 15J16-1T3B]
MRVLLFLLLGLLALRSPARAAEEPPAHLELIENRGQWAAAVRYAAAVPGGQLYAEAHGLTYVLTEALGEHPHAAGSRPARPQLPALVRGQAVQLRFIGAEAAALEPALPTGEVRNYFRGNNPHRWASQVPSYRQLRYRRLWPGIDARLYENARQELEYDFELAAGADPNLIGLRYTGADQLRLRPDGALLIQTGVGTITELAPQAWQLDARGQRRPVPCRYVLQGSEVRFRLGRYDRTRPLVIDPTVVFSTYTGSRKDNWGFTATYDQQGNLYSGGIIFGVGYPASPGAFQVRPADSLDIAVIKYNTAATGPAARVWATYLGGSRADYPESMVVNSQGELLVLGTSSSIDYPTTPGAYDRSFNLGTAVDPYQYGPAYLIAGGTDIVVTRFNATGSALVGSTYLGGSGNDGILDPQSTASPLVHNYGDPFRGDIIVDAADNVYLASNTSSANFPVPSGFQTTYRNNTDAVVCKLNPGLTNLLWSSFLGGAGSDAAYSLQLGPTGAVFVCGGTNSPDFPAPGNTLHPTARGGVADGFVVRIGAGGALERGSYLGTSSYDQAYFVQLDTDGDVYLLGQSLGAYPVTAGRYVNPGSHQFIHQLDANLQTTGFSTVFGSGRSTIDISPTAFLVDQCDRIYVSGWGGDLNNHYPPLGTNGTTAGLPVTPGAVQSTTDEGDFYLLALSPAAQALEYATYYGSYDPFVGDHVDGGTSRFDPRGVIYQAVCSCGSGNWPVPAGAGSYSPTLGPNTYCNNAALKFSFEISAAAAGTDRTICATAGPVSLGGTPFGGVWSGPGVSGSVATGFVFTPSAALIGVQTLTYAYLAPGQSQCSSQDDLLMTVTPPPTVTFAPVTPNAFCLTATPGPVVALSGTPAGGTFSGRGVSGNTFSVAAAGVGTHTLTYSYAQNDCTVQATQQVQVSAPPTVRPGADTLLCAGSTQAVQLRGSPAGGTWSGPGVTAGGVFTPPTGFSTPVTLTYTVAAGACTASATRRVAPAAAPVVTASWARAACPEDREAPLRLRFSLSSNTSLPPADVRWDFGDSTSAVGLTPEHTYRHAPPSGYQPTVTVRYNDGLCSVTQTAPPVSVLAPRSIPNVITPNNDQLNDVFEVTRGCAPQLQIFSRWGNKVYESAAYANDWNGGTQPAGVYYYLLHFPDGRTVKGWLEIVR